MANNPYILLAEDDSNDEALVLRVLTKYRIWNEVVVTRDGAKAWDFIAGSGEFAGRDPRHLPQLILLDSTLPEVGAVELVHRIRATPSLRRIPLVIMASTKEEEDMIRRQNVDGTFPISKPFGFFKLLEALQKLGLYWIVLSEPPAPE